MEIILKEDVEKLGSEGEVVDVADGYARNYLLPRGMAAKATRGKLKEIKREQKRKQRQEREKIEAAKEKASKLESEKYVITVKAGEQGRLFGSVTTKDIAEKIENAGFEIDKRKIQLDDNIKTLGMHKVPVKIYGDISATLKIEVKGT